MKILMTNHRLQQRGGSELFVLEIATGFRRLGHEVCVFTTVPGPLSERLATTGIPVVGDPAECPFTPDILHGQHHLETMAALSLWPGVPATYMVHGATPWEEQAPVHPRIRRYLATTKRLAWYIARDCGVEESSVLVVRNFFDPARFTRVRPPDRRTGRALVFHNTMAPDGPAVRNLERACAACGLTLERIGAAFGRMIDNPEEALPEFDVVFAGGRSAIEAMACGCAVIPVTAAQSTDRIHPGNYQELADRNFTAETNTPPLAADEVAGQLRAIDAAETRQVTQWIREEATLPVAVGRLLDCYQGVLAAPAAGGTEDELRPLGRYLLALAARVKDADARRAALADDKERATQRAAKWKARATHHADHLHWLAQQCGMGSWWQRRWWRKLRREWEARPRGPGQPEWPE